MSLVKVLLAPSPTSPPQRVNAVKFLEPQSASSAYLVSAGEDRVVRLWNAQRPGAQPLHAFSGHGAEVLDVAIAPGGLKAASCGLDRAAIVWDVAAGTALMRLFGHDAKINACAFRGVDGAVLATGSDDGTVRMWDCRTLNKAPLQVLPRLKDAATGVCVDETTICVTSVDGALSTFDVRSSRITVDKVGAPLGSLALSRDAKCVLVSVLGQNARLALLERASGAVLRTFGGHANSAYSLACAFDHADARVFSGSEDSVVRGWDLVSGVVVTQIECDGPALGVAHHPSLALLAVGTAKGSLAVHVS